jgi:DNA-binding transcriptional LysR family regulator
LKIRNLQDLRVFVLAADSGSLSTAAHMLDLSPAVASASLKRLESDLGAVLLVRSTRSLRLSPEGESLLPAARCALAELSNALDDIAQVRSSLREELRVSMPSDLGRNHLLAWLDSFLLQHPDVTLRTHVSDRPADLYQQPIDIAIRYTDTADSGLVALPIRSGNRRVLCAAPNYLARHGVPNVPGDLSRHNCLRFRLGSALHEHWRFSLEGQEIVVTVNGNRIADDGDAVHRWALAGHGIAYKSALDVGNSIAAGLLVPLCTEWTTEAAPLSLVCADRRQLSPLVMLLRDHLQLCCANLAEGFPAASPFSPAR